MKKLLVVIVIVTLPLIAFFQYRNYQRFHPPVSYDYAIQDGVDIHYHDPSMVEEYYSKALEVSSFARAQWRNNGIDVRFPDTNDQEAVNAAKLYEVMMIRLKYLEDVLSNSQQLKSQGLGNEEVQAIEQGAPMKLVALWPYRDQLYTAKIGDVGEHVFLVQQHLIEKGYEHGLDGVFGADTQNALIRFQDDNGLYGSGQMSPKTCQVLFAD